jgi:hypothetical protein
MVWELLRSLGEQGVWWMTLHGWDGLDQLEDRTRAFHSRWADDAIAFRRCELACRNVSTSGMWNMLARPLYDLRNK